jgi:glycosyltransferase involved in cell wall biosynthesis
LFATVEERTPVTAEAPVGRPSITAFFPCYNDSATIGDMVAVTDQTLRMLSDDYEIVVVNDGSPDDSAVVLEDLRAHYPSLRVVTHDKNRGYGGALRSGFGAATKDLVFYTDGDAQYDPRELVELCQQLTPDVDVVQGWKIARHDPIYRKVVGRLYHHFVCFTFGLDVKDVDCDFRLMRRHVLQSLPLVSDSGCITVELVARLTQEGYRVREVPVHHFERQHGRSQFFNLSRVSRTLWQLGGLWFRLRLGLESSQASSVPVTPVQAE